MISSYPETQTVTGGENFTTALRFFTNSKEYTNYEVKIYYDESLISVNQSQGYYGVSVGTNGFLSYASIYDAGYLLIMGYGSEESYIGTGYEDNLIIHWIADPGVAGNCLIDVEDVIFRNLDESISENPQGIDGSVEVLYNVPTPTPDSSDISVKAQYRCGNSTLYTEQINPQLDILNTGDVAVPLSAISLRYYYSKDATYCEEFLFVSVGEIGVPTIQHSFQEKYFELSFADSLVVIEERSNTGEINIHLEKSNSYLYAQENDYSFDPTKTGFTDWDHITLY